MSEIKLKYDPQVDVLRIRFKNTPIEESDEVEPGVILDYDEVGNVVGIELLDVSSLVKQHTQAHTALKGKIDR
jgi:uncharacterized protein YuzE